MSEASNSEGRLAGQVSSHLRRNVYGLIAIFIALGGTAIAATAPKNSVKSKSIADGQVKTADLANDAVTGDKVAINSLGGPDINEASLQLSPSAGGVPGGPAGGDLAGTYPNPTVGANAIGSSKVADGSLAAADILDQTLTGADVADTSSLGGAEINEASLDPTVLQSRIGGTCAAGSSIRVVDQTGAVTCEADDTAPTGPATGGLAGNYPNPTIAPNAVANGQLADNAVGSVEVIDESLRAEDLGQAFVPNNTPAVAIAANDCIVLNAATSVTSMEAGDVVLLAMRADFPDGLIATPTVVTPAAAAANQVQYRICNVTDVAIPDPGSAIGTAIVLRRQ